MGYYYFFLISSIFDIIIIFWYFNSIQQWQRRRFSVSSGDLKGGSVGGDGSSDSSEGERRWGIILFFNILNI